MSLYSNTDKYQAVFQRGNAYKSDGTNVLTVTAVGFKDFVDALDQLAKSETIKNYICYAINLNAPRNDNTIVDKEKLSTEEGGNLAELKSKANTVPKAVYTVTYSRVMVETVNADNEEEARNLALANYNAENSTIKTDFNAVDPTITKVALLK